MESQLRERRKGFKRRREALERIQGAAGELERRIGEVQAQDERLTTWIAKVDELAAALRAVAAETPSVSEAPSARRICRWCAPSQRERCAGRGGRRFGLSQQPSGASGARVCCAIL